MQEPHATLLQKLLQWQLAFLYLSTGICKAHGQMWWDGTVIHYVLNDVAMTHFSYAQFPLPFFVLLIE